MVQNLHFYRTHGATLAVEIPFEESGSMSGFRVRNSDSENLRNLTVVIWMKSDLPALAQVQHHPHLCGFLLQLKAKGICKIFLRNKSNDALGQGQWSLVSGHLLRSRAIPEVEIMMN